MFSTIFYYITFYHGLSPFKFNNTSPRRIVESKLFASIGVVAGLFFCTITVYTQGHAWLTWTPERPKLVMLLVSFLESFSLIVQNVSIFCIQLGNRKELIKFLNDGFDLTSDLKKISPQDVIFSTKFRKHLRSKVISKCFQVIWLSVNTLSFCVRENNIYHWLFGLATSSVYWYSMVISSLYYCGSILISARFYEILNSKIINLAASINEDEYKLKPSEIQMQYICDVSDEIDCIAVLYNRITLFVELINKYLSVQVVLIKICSFVLTLSSVKCDDLKTKLKL